MRTNYLPPETTHNSLQFHERQPLLTSFESCLEQRVGPVSDPDGQSLDFKVVGDRHNFIDLKKIKLQITCCIRKHDGGALDYPADPGTTAPDNTNSNRPQFVHNALHSLFSECDVYANGERISTTNGYYAHKAYLETEMSHSPTYKQTLLKCQGYNYEPAPHDLTSAEIVGREAETRKSAYVSFIGKLAVDFFLPNVSLRVRLQRSHPDFAVISEAPATAGGATKEYRIQITEAYLIVQKVTVN